MKIAIHHVPGTFSDRWIEYCRENALDFKLVDCYKSDIIQNLEDCDALMWHFDHTIAKDMLFAKQLILSLEASGVKTFPNSQSCWHFNDKVGQKYLLESVDAGLVPSYVFYSKKEALDWANKTNYPKVFKLRGGAGSENVKLIRSSYEARRIIGKAFGKGFRQYKNIYSLQSRIAAYKDGKDTMLGILKGAFRMFIPNDFIRSRKELARTLGNERGYVYFQDFIPGNDSDVRIIVIGDKAFAIKRLVRKNDFRASGSGKIIYDVKEIDKRCVELAFDTSAKLKTDCLAYDMVFDQMNNPKILEISFGFLPDAYSKCEGYWDRNLAFHKGVFNPYAWMIERILYY